MQTVNLEQESDSSFSREQETDTGADVSGYSSIRTDAVTSSANVLPKEPTPKWIYFIECDAPIKAIKIGYAANVEQRVSNIQTCNPHPITLLAKLAVLDPAAEESWLHQRFSLLKIRGEWYRGEAEVIAMAEEAHSLFWGQKCRDIVSVPANWHAQLDDPEPLLSPSWATPEQLARARSWDEEARIRRAEARAEARARRAAPAQVVEDVRRALARPRGPRRPGPGEFEWRGRIRRVAP